MSKLHLSFRNFRPELLAATETLFTAKPWAMTDDEALDELGFEDDTTTVEAIVKQIAAGQAWLDAACDTYGLPRIELVHEAWRNSTMYVPADDDNPARIEMPTFGIVRLFAAFAEHRADNSMSRAGRNPTGFAYSLYYQVRPKMFRRLVRQGKMGAVQVRDLYTSETWDRIQAHRLDPSRPDVLSVLARINAGEDVVGSTEILGAADEAAMLETITGEANMDRLRALATSDADGEDEWEDEAEDLGTEPIEPDDEMEMDEDGITPVDVDTEGDHPELSEIPAEGNEEQRSDEEQLAYIRSMNRDELRLYAREAGILNVSRYTKDELLVRLGAA